MAKTESHSGAEGRIFCSAESRALSKRSSGRVLRVHESGRVRIGGSQVACVWEQWNVYRPLRGRIRIEEVCAPEFTGCSYGSAAVFRPAVADFPSFGMGAGA